MFRPISHTDYSKIKHIARTVGGFSEPTDYMLWMFSETQNEISFVYTDDYTEEVLGYVLCLRMAHKSQNNIFCWQMGGMATKHCAGRYVFGWLFNHLVQISLKNDIDHIYFTCEDKRKKRIGKFFELFLKNEIQLANSYSSPKDKGINEQMYFVEVDKEKFNTLHTYH